MLNGKRVRMSLKTRDLDRANRRMKEMDEENLGHRKTVAAAIEAFHEKHKDNATETKRKYRRLLGYLEEYCARESVRFVDKVTVDHMDGYECWRNKNKWAWIKEIEVLRQFLLSASSESGPARTQQRRLSARVCWRPTMWSR
jgi:hypothetical protein